MASVITLYDAATAIGSRERNQDAFLVNNYLSSVYTDYPQAFSGRTDPGDGLFVCAVCDGIGMFERSGEAAVSALAAVRAAAHRFAPPSEGADALTHLRHWVKQAVAQAHGAVTQADRSVNAGGCTMVLLAVYLDCYVLANVGDSPAFALEDGSFTELSVRHTLANLKRMMGQTPTEDEERMLRHYLGRRTDGPSPEYSEKYGTVNVGSRVVLCSDGVFGQLGEEVLRKALASDIPAPQIVCTAAKGEDADNCTAIVIRFSPEENAADIR